ncbi:heterokaryon incompatibility protein-domain-containing protein [Biscogniauxia marginata]|nr:heterokaryon incompatibility protein-domain-containing protein [Biscogniauxia marginata]
MERWNLDVAPFLYLPLEGHQPFRLLLVHPGLPDEPLVTELIVTTLDKSEGQYEATSYTWGSPEDPPCIICNDVKLRIQRNAFDMLRDLRLPDQPRKVWIDAVCIDQSNLSERAAQVSIMHHIYRQAKAVIVWLGQPDEYSSVAMEFAATLDTEKYMKEYIAGYEGGYGSYLRSKQKTYFLDAELAPKEEDGESRLLATAIVSILNRPWFGRVWVQQEAALCSNTKVICGSKVVDWENLLALAWIMEPRQTDTWPDFIAHTMDNTLNHILAVKEIQKVRRKHFQLVYDESQTNVSFETLVINSCRYGATDPRDRIYALQNMAMDSDKWVNVDYTVPWEIVYADLARRFLQSGGLTFLRNAGKSRHEVYTVLPSWAPDYRHSLWSSTTIICHPLWRAGGHTQVAWPRPPYVISAVQPLPRRDRKKLDSQLEMRKFDDPRKVLLQSYASVNCTMADEIVYIGGLLDVENGEFSSNIKAIVDMIQEDLDYIKTLEPQTYFNGETLPDAYKLTLILSSDQEQELVGSEYVRAHWDDWISWHKQGSPNYWDLNYQAPVLNYSFESSAVMKSFRFAITKHGYFCLVPRVAQLHDLVGVFQDYDLGVVIRPWTPPSRLRKGDQDQTGAGDWAVETSYFELIGDSYIHGMMNNEARCIMDEFHCKYKPTRAQWNKILEASDFGRGEQWRTLDLNGGYSRILVTLGPRPVKLV